jgi:hypothetical protein
MSDYREMAGDVNRIIDELNFRCADFMPPTELLVNMHFRAAQSSLLSALTEIRRLGSVLPMAHYVAPSGRPTHFPVGSH